MVAMMVGRQGHQTYLSKGTPLRMIQAQWFQRRRFLKKFTDGCQVMAIAHMTLWVR
jgi:hypothetical protein